MCLSRRSRWHCLFVDQPVAPVVGTIVIVIGSHVADGAAALDAVDVLLPTHHWSAWTALFGAPNGGTQLATGIASAATWLIGTAIVAVWRMRTRDVLS